MAARKLPGITTIHKRYCATHSGRPRCDCRPSYRAEAWDNAAQRRVYRSFPTPTAAANWRRDMQVAIKSGTTRATDPVTVRDAYLRWLIQAEQGVVKARGGKDYKPGVIRSYQLSWEGRLLKALGHRKIRELRRIEVQRLIDRMVESGLAAQTVRNTINALRVVCKWAIRDELLLTNPCDNVELPSGGTARDRICGPSEALELVQAIIDPQDRALYATAFFAGLRRGELMALRWGDVDLAVGTIRVRQSYDPRTKTFGLPKSKKGTRTVWIPELLVPFLTQLWETARVLSTTGIEPDRDDLVFARSQDPSVPFADSSVAQRVVPRWKALDLEPIGLHEARHTFASLMIAANVNIKTISEFMGHSSVMITLDRYGHLLPGAGPEAAALFNAYLEERVHA